MYHENRMVLRNPLGELEPIAGLIQLAPDDNAARGRVETIARAGHYPLVESNEGEDEAGYRCYRCWGVSPTLWMMYVEDLTTGAALLNFFGEDPLEVAEISRRILLMFTLNPYSREELLADPGRLQGPEKVKAILRVALAMGDDDDPEYFAVLENAAKDAVPEVRVAAAWSTVYLASPESLALVADQAANDPDDAVRKNAAELLHHFSRSG